MSSKNDTYSKRSFGSLWNKISIASKNIIETIKNKVFKYTPRQRNTNGNTRNRSGGRGHLRKSPRRKMKVKHSNVTRKFKNHYKGFQGFPVGKKYSDNNICDICTCVEGAVYCSDKNISTPLDKCTWNGLARFEPVVVDFSKNPVTNITVIPKLPIQVLNLSYCQLQHFETSSLTLLEDMISLDLSSNEISTNDLIDLSKPEKSTSRPFSRMQALYLAHNSIHTLPPAWFKFMSNLTYLDISDNPLASIGLDTKKAISVLTQLKHLVIRNCKLETLPSGLFKNQKKLNILELNNNRLKTVPLVLQDIPKLLFLSLDRNPITTIDNKGPISKLRSLEELHISHMSKLRTISANSIGGLPRLGTLRLSHNPRLTSLDPEFLVYRDDDLVPHWPSLRKLHLNNNNLSTINSKFLDNWSDLVDGDFSNNPYDCDCENQWMVNFLIPLMKNFKHSQTIYRMHCSQPPSLKGMPFAHMSSISKILPCYKLNSKWEPTSFKTLAVGTSGLAVVSFIIIYVILWWKKLKKRRNQEVLAAVWTTKRIRPS